jgi:hypothetical protein
MFPIEICCKSLNYSLQTASSDQKVPNSFTHKKLMPVTEIYET